MATLRTPKEWYEEALAGGVPASYVEDFLKRNPGDYHRLLSSYSGTPGVGGDVPDTGTNLVGPGAPTTQSTFLPNIVWGDSTASAFQPAHTSFERLPPGMRGPVSQAQDYLRRQLEPVYGKPLGDVEWRWLAEQAGYTGGDVTSEQVNRALEAAERYFHQGGSPSPAPPTPKPPSRPPLPPFDPNIYGGPGGGGVFPDPTQQFGQDPFSRLLTGGLASLVFGGGAPLSEFGQKTTKSLEDLIASGGALPDKLKAQRFEAIREPIERGRRAQLRNVRAELANRGQLGYGREPSALEQGALSRIEERLAPIWATALQQAGLAQQEGTERRFEQALGLSAQETAAQRQAMLSALGGGTQRQAMLSDTAIRSLEQNRLWNEFLATFGLERDQAIEAIRMGRLNQLSPYLNMFMRLLETARGGYV